MRSKLFLLLAILLAASCQSNKKKIIAVIPKSTSSIYWISVQAGALAAAQEFNVSILWTGPAQESEYSRQIEIVDSMITRRVDGIALAAAERKALVRTIDRAAAEKVPLTVFDSGVESTNYVSFVATNNYEAGQLGGRTLAKLLNGKGKVAVVMHAPGSGSTMDRERGFEDVIRKEFPGIEIVAEQYGQADRAKSMSAAENIFTAHPDLNGIFGSSEPCAVGISQALKSRKLSGNVKFVGFDSSDGLIEDMKAGVIDALVVQDPFKMGFEAVHTIVQTLKGETPSKRMDLSARVVTRDDLDKPEVKQFLFPDIKKYLPQ